MSKKNTRGPFSIHGLKSCKLVSFELHIALSRDNGCCAHDMLPTFYKQDFNGKRCEEQIRARRPLFVLARARSSDQRAHFHVIHPVCGLCHPSGPRGPQLRSACRSCGPCRPGCQLSRPAGPQLRSACHPSRAVGPQLRSSCHLSGFAVPLLRLGCRATPIVCAVYPALRAHPSSVARVAGPQPVRRVPPNRSLRAQLRSACHPSGVVGIVGVSPDVFHHVILKQCFALVITNTCSHSLGILTQILDNAIKEHLRQLLFVRVYLRLRPLYFFGQGFCAICLLGPQKQTMRSQMIRGLDLLQPSHKPTLPCVQGHPPLSWDLH